MAERKLVVVNDTGILHELGGIGGPICAPTRIPIPAILKMINNQRHVYECNPLDPRNPAMQVRLTQENYKSENFGKSQPASEETEPVTQTDAPETPVTKQVADTEPEKEAEREPETPETEADAKKTDEAPSDTDVKTESEDHTNDEEQDEEHDDVKDETPTDQTPVSEAAEDKKPTAQPAKTTKSSKKKK